ncbi:MAG: hypothetical protein M3081_19080 [Gemmatimonadota bacterium]|nr:hypothetical protein [Gemmatimonadota bacterium]
MLIAPVVLTAIIVFVLRSRGQQSSAREAAPPGWAMVTLAQKDAGFNIVPPERGGAQGSVLYHTRGDTLPLRYRAAGLAPGLHYLVELQVDTTVYTIATVIADAAGVVAFDTSLSNFAEGVCVGRNYDPPRPLAGEHVIKFWLKRDGNAATGTQAQLAPGTPHPELPCRGNGDAIFSYVLLETELAHFEGVSPRP